MIAESDENPDRELENLKMMEQFMVDGLIVSLCSYRKNIEMYQQLEEAGMAVDGLKEYTSKASGVFMMGVFGGAVFPVLQGLLADYVGSWQFTWLIPLFCEFVILWYGLVDTNKFLKVTLHLNNKNKKFPFYFVLSSICCNFAPANYNLIKVVFQLIKRLDYE